LKQSGFDDKLKYESVVNRKRKRSRNIIYFNPPYNANVKTNVCQFFLRLIRKHFPSGHRYSNLFNKNTLKLSYSCMENVGDIIKKHNAKMLAENEPLKNDCNCRKKKRIVRWKEIVNKNALCTELKWLLKKKESTTTE